MNASVRWTHFTIPVSDMDGSVRFFTDVCGLAVVRDRRLEGGRTVWVGPRPPAGRDPQFVAVLFEGPVAEPLNHFGFQCDAREDVTTIAERARETGALVEGPEDAGGSVGYYAIIREPSGHLVEFTFGQPLEGLHAEGSDPVASLSRSTTEHTSRSPGDAPLLARIREELVRVHQAHTILLYGSRANGTEGPHSDYDIAAFAPVTRTHRDTRLVEGEYLDVFVYPEAALQAPAEEHLKLRESVVLLQRDDAASRFLAGLEALYQRGPEPLAADEMAVRRSWAWKMNARLRRGDAEGNFRRVWLLTALLEDYFHLRGLWFEGPKRALSWLAEHDPPVHAAFDRALSPDAPTAAIEALVAAVVGAEPL